MPRPGPRPYECVRRAWHSDRHHPVRGSLIKEIFRIVNEVHCSATRKNREWQEKIPIVVLKAEEIMYSKASSEAEYSDLQTLWDRVNDAINAIIRRDESTESGEFLLPCIEAALHLGCTPRRSSRSQRNDAPRCYLRPEKLEGSINSNSKLCGNPVNINPLILHCPQYATFNSENPLRSCSNGQDHGIQTRTSNNIKEFKSYPLYYNDQIRSDDCKFFLSKNSYPNLKNDKTSHPKKCHPLKVDSSDARWPSYHDPCLDKGCRTECDLTLRLGSVVVPCVSIENRRASLLKNGARSPLEGMKFKSRLNK